MPLRFLLPLTFMTFGHAFPWPGAAQTQSPTSTANWSPAPTSDLRKDESFLELIRRDIFPVSVCGWIGGEASKPAYCSTHSSCVWNSDNSIVGCCATGSSACKFYATCIDLNSPEQSGDRDDVFTCKGLSVCYSNHYPDNYIQWGCGSSDWATTVATTFEGMGQDLSLQIVITGSDSPSTTTEPSSTSEPPSTTSTSDITSETSTPPSSSESTTLPTTSRSDTQSTSSPTNTSPPENQTTSPAPSQTPTPSPPSHKSSTPIGPIVGGVLGGVALLAFLAFLLFFGKKRGWFKKKQSAPEGTAFLDSNPVFEMGGSEFPVKKAGYSDQPSAGGYGNVNGNYGVGGEDGRGNKRLSELP